MIADCIREDRPFGIIQMERNTDGERAVDMPCLLYTSDAADERSSVDLGGRRIIKKKKKNKRRRRTTENKALEKNT